MQMLSFHCVYVMVFDLEIMVVWTIFGFFLDSLDILPSADPHV